MTATQSTAPTLDPTDKVQLLDKLIANNQGTERASPRQIDFLRALAQQRAIFGPRYTPKETTALLEERFKCLPRNVASFLIDYAKTAPFYPDDQVPAPAWLIAALREKAETRAIFGIWVSREETLARIDALAASEPTRAAVMELIQRARDAKPYPTEKSPLPLSVVDGIDGVRVSEGHYAVMVDGELRFYRIYTSPSGEYTGQAVIRRYSSDGLLPLYPAEARTVLTLIQADEATAAYRFADAFTRCFVCGKLLTDAVSRLLSVGPDCRGFTADSGLRAAARAVDQDPKRREVYRALRQWALSQGYRDPRDRSERETMQNTITASRLAAAWSGLPGILNHDPSEVVVMVERALTGKLDDKLRDALLAAREDTLLVLISSGVLSGPVLSMLANHPSTTIQAKATDYFMAALAA